jgi:hypothetical protein
MKKLLFLFVLCGIISVHAIPFPIQFSIPESKIVTEIPEKDTDFATIIPGRLDTYIYDEEADYYNGYKRAYFAVTQKKGGWDCMRHYEILANGCIPYFVGLKSCDLHTMHLLPRELILEAMNLEGVSSLHIDHTKFNREKYNEILNKLLAHTRQYLTTRNMAKYLLDKVNYSGKGKILFLSGATDPDYLRETTLIGLKELYGDRVVDYPKIDFLYSSYKGNIKHLYGKGISYTKNLEDLPLDRTNIENRIASREEFEIIIYGSVHRGLPFHDLVRQYYPPEKIIYICGDDKHSCPYYNWNNLFLREWESHIIKKHKHKKR